MRYHMKKHQHLYCTSLRHFNIHYRTKRMHNWKKGFLRADSCKIDDTLYHAKFHDKYHRQKRE